MKKTILLPALLLAVTAVAKGDVVMSPGTYNGTLNSNLATSGAGLQFTTGASSVNWRVSSIQFSLGTAGSLTLSQVTVRLFKLNGANWEFVTGSLESTSPGTSLSVGENAVTFTMSPNSAYGIAGDQSSGLLANTAYMLGIDVTTTNNSSVWWGASSTASSGSWGSGTSVQPNPAGAWSSSTYATSAISNWGSGNNLRMEINAFAVPEPSTLLLGGIASMRESPGHGGNVAKKR